MNDDVNYQAQMMDVLMQIARNQSVMMQAVGQLAESLSTIEEVLYELAKPKKLVRDQSGKVIGIEPAED